MNPRELTVKIKKSPIFPAYYFYGNESYLKNNAVALIKEKYIGTDVKRGLNYEIFYGKDTLPEKILNNANTIPLLAGKNIAGKTIFLDVFRMACGF